MSQALHLILADERGNPLIEGYRWGCSTLRVDLGACGMVDKREDPVLMLFATFLNEQRKGENTCPIFYTFPMKPLMPKS